VASAKLSIFDCRSRHSIENRQSAIGNCSPRATALFQRLPPLARLTFATMVWMLVVAALFASLPPARRASRVDRMSALREEYRIAKFHFCRGGSWRAGTQMSGRDKIIGASWTRGEEGCTCALTM